jgi:hypothetical protein
LAEQPTLLESFALSGKGLERWDRFIHSTAVLRGKLNPTVELQARCTNAL